MPVSDRNESKLPTFEVKLGPKVLDPKVLVHVVRIAVDLSLDKAGMFSMELSGFGAREHDTAWIDNELFAVGKPVRVRMGYGEILKTVFGGEITGLDPSFSCGRPPTLTLRGYDRSHRLQRGDKTRTFRGRKHSDIAIQIATEARLTPIVDDSRVVHEFVQQSRQNDLDFLRGLAEKIDYTVRVHDTTLLFQRINKDEARMLTLTMEKDLIDFSAGVSAAHQPSRVLVSGWDMREKKPIVCRMGPNEEAFRRGEGPGMVRLIEERFGQAVEVVAAPIMSQAEADQIALARLNRIARSLIEGSGSTLWRGELAPGMIVNIAGLGQRFSGRYYVTNTTHHFDHQNGYRTSFSVRRNAL